MKQKKTIWSLAASMMLAVGLISCQGNYEYDNPVDPVGPVEPEVVQMSLKDVPFGSWSAWVDGEMTQELEPTWNEGKSDGLPYGDGSVINYADLTPYTKLIVTVTEGTPRFLLNRDVNEGQWNEDETQSHLIEYPKGDEVWSAKYFSAEAGENEGETVYTVDIAQIVADTGYAHLHAIKGANWQPCTAISMVVEYTK